MAVLHFVGYGWKAGLVLGGALAMSSTAIVSKMLAERMELGTQHGRDSMAILLFQDLAVVAFLIIIPSLGKAGGEMAIELGIAAAKAAVALTLILYFGQKPMRAGSTSWRGSDPPNCSCSMSCWSRWAWVR
jgi:CPA2 family monovalent cation:H+ antiporter-2